MLMMAQLVQLKTRTVHSDMQSMNALGTALLYATSSYIDSLFTYYAYVYLCVGVLVVSRMLCILVSGFWHQLSSVAYGCRSQVRYIRCSVYIYTHIYMYIYTARGILIL